jgi:hypothetical protein
MSCPEDRTRQPGDEECQGAFSDTRVSEDVISASCGDNKEIFTVNIDRRLMQVGGYFVFGLLVSTDAIMNDTRNLLRPLEPILYAEIVCNFRPGFHWRMSVNPPARLWIGLPFYPQRLHKHFHRPHAALSKRRRQH